MSPSPMFTLATCSLILDIMSHWEEIRICCGQGLSLHSVTFTYCLTARPVQPSGIMEIWKMTMSFSLQQHDHHSRQLADVLWMTTTPSQQSHLFLFCVSVWTAAKSSQSRTNSIYSPSQTCWLKALWKCLIMHLCRICCSFWNIFCPTLGCKKDIFYNWLMALTYPNQQSISPCP